MKKSYKAYSDGSYLQKSDIDEPKTWVIRDVEERSVPIPGGQRKDKLVVFFEGVDKGLICNQTNGGVLAELSGFEDPSEWIGTEVTVYVDPNITYGGRKIGGIRLRKPSNEPF